MVARKSGKREEMLKRDKVIEKRTVISTILISRRIRNQQSFPAILIGGHCAGNIIVLSGGVLWKGEVIKRERRRRRRSRRVVKRGRRKGREKGGGNKREKEEEKKFVHEERTNDNNDEPNIDPVKPVRLPSLYSPRAPLLSTSFSPRASIFTPSFQLSLSLSPSREQKPGYRRQPRSLGTLLEQTISLNAGQRLPTVIIIAEAFF